MSTSNTTKIRANLAFAVSLEAGIPNTGIGAAISLLKTEEILNRAKGIIQPILDTALMGALDRLKFLGINVRILKSHVDLHETKDK